MKGFQNFSARIQSSLQPIQSCQISLRTFLFFSFSLYLRLPFLCYLRRLLTTPRAYCDQRSQNKASGRRRRSWRGVGPSARSVRSRSSDYLLHPSSSKTSARVIRDRNPLLRVCLSSAVVPPGSSQIPPGRAPFPRARSPSQGFEDSSAAPSGGPAADGEPQDLRRSCRCS